MQVFVDEATDLSAVQLACTVELADPNLRSWFASGDLRQPLLIHALARELQTLVCADGDQRVFRVLIDRERRASRLRRRCRWGRRGRR